jgi:betaine-aldehyde dehydrogenase
MASQSTNPFVWDRPFAFLWLTPDENHPSQHTLAHLVTELARNADFKCELPKSDATPVESIMSFPFMPHVTLHTSHLDGKDVEASIEQMITRLVDLSASFGSEPLDASQLKVKLSSPVMGVTHFKSVYLDVVNEPESSTMLSSIKKKAEALFGPNVPSETTYLPHLSLWYGTNERLRKLTYEAALASEVSDGLEIPLSHLHLVYAPFEDVRSWKIVGSTRVGCDVFFRRTAFIGGSFEFLRNSNLKGSAPHLERLPIFNPASGEVMAYMEGCHKEEAERAIGAAQAAFPIWSGDTSLAQRLVIVRKLVALIRERADYLAKLETTDNGKPLKEAQADVNDAADCFSYYASLAESDKRLNGESDNHIETGSEQLQCAVHYEAIGVCAMILPFNYPLLMAAWKLGPALLAGCTVVLKPSEMTSATALELAALCREAGVPAGVLNVLPGLGPSVGPTLTSHPSVRKIAFTGSGATGKHILKESTKHLPNVSLELGGKSPALIFQDADIEAGIDWILMGIFFNAGQVCSATSRLLIHSSLYDKVKQVLKEKAELLKKRVGDGRDPNTLLGPLVSLSQYNRVRHLVENGIAQGAKLVTGQSNFEKAAIQRKGFYFDPTIVENVKSDNTLWTNEVFGPVLVIRSFETEQEALQLANDSPFGLAAAVFTQDKERQRRIARQLQVGIVWINCSQPTLVQAPWGGMKESGVGRELGPWGLENFLEPKQITEWVTKDNFGWYQSL